MRFIAWSCVFATITVAGCSGDGTNPLNSSPTLRTNERNAATPPAAAIMAMVSSEPKTSQPGAPAIWVNREDPSKSLVFATYPEEAGRTLFTFDLAGKQVESLDDLQEPTAIDVQHDLKIGDELVDIVSVAEPGKHRLRIFKIDRTTGKLEDISGRNQVFVGKEEGTKGVTGLGLYRRQDGAVFVTLSPKEGAAVNRLAQYRLEPNSEGKVDLVLSRYFGKAPAKEDASLREVDSITVDDERGFIYWADATGGLRKFLADPDAKDADQEVAFFATSGYAGPRQGVGIFSTGEGTGYILSGESAATASQVHLFPREGSKSNPHEHASAATVATASDNSNGLDATAMPLGTQFPNGLLVMVNKKDKNLSFYDWGQIAQRGNLRAAR